MNEVKELGAVSTPLADLSFGLGLLSVYQFYSRMMASVEIELKLGSLDLNVN